MGGPSAARTPSPGTASWPCAGSCASSTRCARRALASRSPPRRWAFGPHRRLLHHWAPSMHSGPGEQGAACLWWIVLLELLSHELCTWETLQYMSRNINTR